MKLEIGQLLVIIIFYIPIKRFSFKFQCRTVSFVEEE